ncbi:hypothetical protein CC78DRAFT_538463 [Lojkania enalia]|uniref:Uncharacterized protein n=1 Tax=Lojkania enalia TaxID=147567 RepID=A0A9P4MXJ3_9PLEO|nr:hypothetical protein CC78DRAFT_538463 [Didymosphaeria enalia]
MENEIYRLLKMLDDADKEVAKNESTVKKLQTELVLQKWNVNEYKKKIAELEVLIQYAGGQSGPELKDTGVVFPEKFEELKDVCQYCEELPKATDAEMRQLQEKQEKRIAGRDELVKRKDEEIVKLRAENESVKENIAVILGRGADTSGLYQSTPLLSSNSCAPPSKKTKEQQGTAHLKKENYKLKERIEELEAQLA